MGMEGIGIYWCLVEMMYENDGFLMQTDCDSYAFALRVEKSKILQLIDLVFVKQQSKYTSASVQKRLKERKEKSKLARKSAEIRWSDGNAKAMRSHSDGNANKVNKSKVNIYKGNLNLNNPIIAHKSFKSWCEGNSAAARKLDESFPLKQFESYWQEARKAKASL